MADLPPIPDGMLTPDMPLLRFIEEAYQNSAAHGFHQEGQSPELDEVQIQLDSLGHVPTALRQAFQNLCERAEKLSPLEQLGKMMLMVTELAEAAEDTRGGNLDTKYEHKLYNDVIEATRFSVKWSGSPDTEGKPVETLGKPVGLLSEYADVVIRVFDEIGRLKRGEEFVRVLVEKQLYNRTRPVMHGKNC